MCRLLIAFAAGALLSAQIAPTPPSQTPPPPFANTPPKKPGRVEGTVTNSVTGAPVKKAIVTLTNTAERFSYAAATDSTGHFTFETVAPGAYRATAERVGFNPPLDSRSAPIEVAEEQTAKNVSVKLLPLGILSGRIRDNDGQPIMNAFVALVRTSFDSFGKKVVVISATADTNDLGEYRFPSVLPGSYYVRAASRHGTELPPNTISASSPSAFPITFYPGVPTIDQAKRISVSPGSELSNIDLSLRRQPAYLVKGKVTDAATGTPAPSLVFLLDPVTRIDLGLYTGTDKAGNFTIHDVPPGSYVITGREFTSEGEAASFPITVGDRNVEGLALSLSGGFTITGTATLEAPPSTAWPRITVRLVPENLSPRGEPVSNVESDGSFRLEKLASGNYHLLISSVPGRYLKSVRLADRDVAGMQVELTQNAKLELVFGSDPGSLTGSVQRSSGGPVSTFLLLASADDSRGVQTAATEQNAHFVIKDIAPGDYKLFALESFDQSLFSPDLRKALASKAASVTIGPNAQQSIEVTLITADEYAEALQKIP